MKRVTKKTFLLTNPCYSAEKLGPLLALSPDSGTTLRVVIARLLKAAVPAKDIVWLALHECWFEDPEKTLRLLACDFAEILPQSEAGQETIAVARRFAVGNATREELAAASSSSSASAASASAASASAAAYAAAHAYAVAAGATSYPAVRAAYLAAASLATSAEQIALIQEALS